MTDKIEEGVNIKEYIDLALRYKYVIGSIILLFLIIGFVLYKLEVPVYSATAILAYQSSNPNNLLGERYSIQSKIDANVIIFERIREELKGGHCGYELYAQDCIAALKKELHEKGD